MPKEAERMLGMGIKFVMLNLLSAAAGTTGKEAATAGWIATIGTFVTLYLGGWDAPLRVLVFLMVADYITGILGAFKTKSVDSEVMFWGGVRKGVVLFVVFLAIQLDDMANNSAPVFRTIALYFYASREGLSVVENLGHLGVPLPEQLTKFLQQLKPPKDNVIEMTERKDVS
jgi:toxin secretion/phage lysis holin